MASIHFRLWPSRIGPRLLGQRGRGAVGRTNRAPNRAPKRRGQFGGLSFCSSPSLSLSLCCEIYPDVEQGRKKERERERASSQHPWSSMIPFPSRFQVFQKARLFGWLLHPLSILQDSSPVRSFHLTSPDLPDKTASSDLRRGTSR